MVGASHICRDDSSPITRPLIREFHHVIWSSRLVDLCYLIKHPPLTHPPQIKIQSRHWREHSQLSRGFSRLSEMWQEERFLQVGVQSLCRSHAWSGLYSCGETPGCATCHASLSALAPVKTPKALACISVFYDFVLRWSLFFQSPPSALIINRNSATHPQINANTPLS